MSYHHWVLLTLLSLIWGGSFFFVELALEAFSPFQLVYLRVSIGALVLAVFVYARGRRLPRDIWMWRDYAVMGLINNVIPFSMIVWGQTQISGGEASILNATTPIFTVLIAHLFTQDERLSVHKMIGVCVGFFGVFVMMIPTMEYGLNLQGYGQLAVICAAVSYGFAGVWGKRMSQQTPNVNAAGMLICSSFLLLPLVLVFEPSFPSAPSYSALLAVVSIGVLCTAFAYILFFKILSGAGATNISQVTLLAPVSAILLGVIFLGEAIGLVHVFGMAFIFAGLIFIDGRLLKRIRG